jgi:hypothetical protein
MKGFWEELFEPCYLYSKRGGQKGKQRKSERMRRR